MILRRLSGSSGCVRLQKEKREPEAFREIFGKRGRTMGMNETPSSERVHIGFFGRRNAGKSSVMNAVTGQELAVVSPVKGTTTDPVLKAMELLPLGPVVMMDTPGLDDEGELGSLRIKKSRQILNKTDAAAVVIDGTEGGSREDLELVELLKKKEIPFLLVFNKSDLTKEAEKKKTDFREAVAAPFLQAGVSAEQIIWTSAETGEGIHELKEALARTAASEGEARPLVRDLISPGETAVLVIPIDKAAPKGRLILPQQQTIRDILDGGGFAMAVKETDLSAALQTLSRKPKLVITDSQAFRTAAAQTPEDIWLTSFSILFARYKGNLEDAVRGVRALDALSDGDQVLISEGCTHHRQCGDIGTVKLPAWIRKYTGKEISFSFTSGTQFPDDLSGYRLVVHCGGCMLNEREMRYRLGCARDQQVPMTNYGILIAYVNGILKRSVEPFPEIYRLLEFDIPQ